jgi:hypothetical protein
VSNSLAETVREEAAKAQRSSSPSGVDTVRKAAEEEAERELGEAVKAGDGARIRRAIRALRDIDDD